MKSFHFEIKWPPVKSPVISIFIILTCFSISINGQCIDHVLKPGEIKNITGESQTCLRLICEEANVIWKKNQDRIIMGMF
jgi:hypothetical protein